ncbi:MAG: reverse transcriptase family protein [Pirellulales bacterium]
MLRRLLRLVGGAALAVAIFLLVPFVLLALLILIPLSSLTAWLRRLRRRTTGSLIGWARARRGWGRSVSRLAGSLGIDRAELLAFKPAYREAFIPKRSGGQRRLLVPDAATKALQRRLLRRVLGRLRAHPAATGFERGRSIVDNARPHVGQAIVIHLDVVDFFPSTSALRIEAYFRRVGWNAQAAALLTRLTTYEGGLPQGAPTSPRLSNLVNYGLDARLASYVRRRGGRYTRYADDITISLDRDWGRRARGFVQKTRAMLRACGYRAHGRRKLSIRRRHQRQEVTGLVVNDKAQLSRERRRWLRAVKHRQATGRPTSVSREQLAGLLAYERMVERQRDGGQS